MEALKVSRPLSEWDDESRDTGERVVEDITRIEGQMKEGFDKVDERFKEADQAVSAIRERLARIETKLEGLARLEYSVWGFGSALLIAVLGPRLF